MFHRNQGGFTLVELLVVITIIGILIGLLLPAVQAARESARRAQCTNNLKQIGLAVLNYEGSLRAYPPGCVVTIPPGAAPEWDAWEEAGPTHGAGCHGTSWMLLVLPYLEQANLYEQWDFTANVHANGAVAETDVGVFYCPSRRNRIRSGDRPMLVDDDWAGGGTDYGACIGSGNGFDNDLGGGENHHFTQGSSSAERYTNAERRGMFLPNDSTQHMQLRDGATATIMLGEMQRLWGSADWERSLDGWAVGGVATLFTTARTEVSGYRQTGGLNNGFFESAGSDHPGGAHFCMADGSVHFLSEHMATDVFHYLGSIADGEAVALPAR